MTDKFSPVPALQQSIKILPPQLANQIAAGEVVERPASVVKELLENSLDAGATQILIEIEQGGQKRILIRDNGVGIAKDELALALSRHATSKISNIDDLEHITSMGFRGEALASISSVSRLTLTSKPPSQIQAWQAVAEGQQMQVEVTPAAHPDGTSIEVLDLFFNTPARRKFLRTGKTEFQHIEQIVKRIALTRPDVQFELKHNQKVCCRYLRVNEISKRIEQVCGKNMLVNCAPVDYSYDAIVLSGWCSKLGHGVATRDFQYTFVNGRMMKDKLLAHAIRQAYEDTLPPQTFASYVLYLQVPPQQIDVNVHPAKHEVRFHQSRQVHDIVFKAINDAISHNSKGQGVNEIISPAAPSHNYIQALSASSNETDANTDVNLCSKDSATNDNHIHGHQQKSLSASSKSPHYTSNKPSSTEISANLDFYGNGLGKSQQALLSTVDENNNENLAAQNTQQIGTPRRALDSYIYSAPYIALAQGEHLRIFHIQALLAMVVLSRMTRSTLSQPLLMPVSVENRHGLQQIDLNRFAALHVVINVSHKKLILKQVPSELRHLPWAGIFARIAIHECVNDVSNSKQIAGTIANAWLNTLEVTHSSLSGWMDELGEEHIKTLCNEHAKALHVPSYMLADDE